MSETFGASELLASLEVLLKGGSETGQTEQGFDAKCELRLTKQCTAMTLLGAGEIGGGTTVGAASAVARSEMAAAGVEASEAATRAALSARGCIGRTRARRSTSS